jgi:hypothetical protein
MYIDDTFVSDTCNIIEGDFLLFEYMKHGQNPYEFIASYFEKLCITEKDKIQTVEDFIQFNNVYTKGVKNIRHCFKCLKNFMTQNNYDLIFMISSYYFYKIVFLEKLSDTFVEKIYDNFDSMISYALIINNFKTFHDKNLGLFDGCNIPPKLLNTSYITGNNELQNKLVSRLSELIVKIQNVNDDTKYESLSNQIYDLITVMPLLDERKTGNYMLSTYNSKVCKRILEGSNLDLEMKILKMIANKYKSHRHLVLTTLDLIKDINETNYVKNIINNITIKVIDQQFADMTFDKDFMDFKLLQRESWCLTSEETFNHEFLNNHKELYFYAKVLNNSFEKNNVNKKLQFYPSLSSVNITVTFDKSYQITMSLNQFLVFDKINKTKKINVQDLTTTLGIFNNLTLNIILNSLKYSNLVNYNEEEKYLCRISTTLF